MTPGRWAQLDELYHAVRSLPPSQRNALLERADPELRATVLSILAHEGASETEDARQPEAFLDRPAWEGRTSLLQHSGSSDAERLLNAGEQLGPYRIEQRIGQGGMGTVYRATDTRLGRPVALKISRKLFDGRLEREARAISSLNHPHICTLHDIGPDFLVMELVEGESLAARIGKGALPVSDVLRYGGQIADALAAAHGKDITHRDLKPANVMITRNGVKVLDFGLARQATADGTETITGAVMGTPAYMAPEQLKGQAADARADIFALGLTLYEMATGKRLAPGPMPVMAGLPPRFVHVVERCLEPEVDDRWQSARDVKAELAWVAAEEAAAGARLAGAVSVRRPKRSWIWLAMATAGVAVVVVGWTLFWNRAAPSPAALNVSLLPPPDTSFSFARNGEGGFSLSPDGTRLAFIARTRGKAHLWLRTLAESESRLLPDSEDAYNPFWSPDARWIGFFTPVKLRKIEVASGSVVDVLDRPGSNMKGSWSSRGVIIYGNPNAIRGGNPPNPIFKVPDTGGTTVPIPETLHGSSPSFLPDGRRFVFFRGEAQKPGVWLASIDPNEKPRNLGDFGTHPSYSQGHILSVVNGVLMAKPFDEARGEFSGDAFPLKAPLANRVMWGFLVTNYSANAQGMLVYPPEADMLSELRWRDRTGKLLDTLGTPGEYYTPRISPDGKRVAFSRRENNNSDIWLADLSAASLTRLTFDPAVDENPVWSPDGAAVTFDNDASGTASLYRKAASGAGDMERLTTASFDQQPLDWSRDGRFLAYTQITHSSEIFIQAVAGAPSLSYLGHARGASKAQFDPGVPPRWIVYDFDDSGRREIYVREFAPGKPASSAIWQISDAGGEMPRWRGDGKEIVYLSLDGKMMAARVSTNGGVFQSQAPQFLFNASPPQLRTTNFEYDVSPDGQRFLMIEPLEKPEYQSLTLISNWRVR